MEQRAVTEIHRQPTALRKMLVEPVASRIDKPRNQHGLARLQRAHARLGKWIGKSLHL